jgi:hypothetical protein
MVAEHGGPEAARQLLKGSDASDGFDVDTFLSTKMASPPAWTID